MVCVYTPEYLGLIRGAKCTGATFEKGSGDKSVTNAWGFGFKVHCISFLSSSSSAFFTADKTFTFSVSILPRPSKLAKFGVAIPTLLLHSPSQDYPYFA